METVAEKSLETAAATALANLAALVAEGLAATGGRDWMDEGVCTTTPGVEVSDFFRKGGVTKETKALCAACPVAQQCDTYATTISVGVGYFGGKTAKSRGVNIGATFATSPATKERIAQRRTAARAKTTKENS